MRCCVPIKHAAHVAGAIIFARRRLQPPGEVTVRASPIMFAPSRAKIADANKKRKLKMRTEAQMHMNLKPRQDLAKCMIRQSSVMRLRVAATENLCAPNSPFLQSPNLAAAVQKSKLEVAETTPRKASAVVRLPVNVPLLPCN